MAYVGLPCGTEEWAEQKNVFFMLSHLRSLDDLELFMESYTRPDAAPSATSKCLSSLRGLVVFLTENCGTEDQSKFLKKTLPFIAKSAALLEQRVPHSGMPLLEKQENCSLVLGRKVVLSLLSNAFLSTFPVSFNFKTFFDVFLEENSEKKSVQAAKLKAILCYFERAAEGRCNLSGVITYRRKVLERNDLPTLEAWCGNPLPLCPLVVDNDLRIENSGGQTLQVCFSSRLPGGEVLEAGSSMEEVRFCVAPEALLVKLVMESLEPNEVIIVTGTERFANCSGSHDKLTFLGELKDESEHDVFGNMLNSFVALDAGPVSSSKPHLQYLPNALLRELNKSYAGFLCQEDRGDICTDKLTLSVKRGSLAFAAEEYPACTSHMNIRSVPVQGEPCSMGESHQGKLIQSYMPQLKISAPHLAADVGEEAAPLSPIPESCESPSSYQAALVGNILMGGVQQFTGVRKSPSPSPPDNPSQKETSVPQEEDGEPKGGVEEFAARMARSLVTNGGQLPGEHNGSTASPIPLAVDDSSGQDTLAAHLATTIINSSLGERMRRQAWAREQEENKKNAQKEEGRNLEEKSDSLARNIITDALLFGGDDQTTGSSIAGKSADNDDDAGERKGTEEVTASTLVSRLTGNIMSEALKSSTTQGDSKPSSTTYPPIVTQEDRRGSIESFRSSRSSSLTGQSITVLDYTDEVAEEVVRDGLSMAQFMLQGMQGQQHPEEEVKEKEEEDEDEVEEEDKDVEEETECDILASDLAYEVVQGGIEMFTSGDSPLHVTKHEVQQPREIIPSFPSPSQTQLFSSHKPSSPLPKRSLLSNIAEAPSKPSLSVGEPENEPPMIASTLSAGPSATTPMSQRLLTPLFSRAGYAWSTASTQDEESRPVSPMDMNKLGLSLSSNTEEFSSLVSEMVISHAIGDATGSEEPTLSPRNINSGDNASFTNSSKIGNYLSQLGEAEPPCDAGVDDGNEGSTDSDDDGNGLASFSSLWDRMKLQLLRPIATGNWGCGPNGGADPQLRAMIQWVAASACGRPHIIFCTASDERVNQIHRVIAHLRSKGFTVGSLCRSLTTFSGRVTGEDKTDLFTALLQL